MRPVLGFAGMTHLGLVSGISAAEKGFRVICFDPDLQRIAPLLKGVLPVSEPSLDELMAKNRASLSFTSNAADLQACDVVYVAPDVPTDDFGGSDLGPINNLLGRVLEASRDDTVIVVLSQVPPGFTRTKQREGRILYYQVETLIFGRAVERALQPERYIVGCADPRRPLPEPYRVFLAAHGCPVLPMRYESAELAKISINMCLVASVSVANTLAELCEHIGADWSEIVPALKLDRRIGPYSYLAPGLGIAGGNLERDLATVCSYADRYGTDAGVVRAWIANSHHRRDWVLGVLYRELLSKVDDPLIAVLGLAYKQDTNSVKNSPSIALLGHLKPFRVRVYDPVVPASVVPHPLIHDAMSELETCEGADVLVLMTPWSQFSGVDPREIAKSMHGKLVLDPYAVLKAAACRDAGLDYRTLGVSSFPGGC
ncbi:MAG: nucleotide sugar dehydrogenase [Polaromonas sp.]|uniref:nucleotide sugar dehydrogenase n=1 Tax=Polaromonas sp. TaxID=1869339 RepID=UPI002488908E|nr:nucleotide sugar dehydrogenase [Polaromonas sp.]MDI1270393.1 nucleotide sugar dehydrogenase [Polaromonas sp.]